MRMHHDELRISARTVEQLISDQFPQWSHEVVEQIEPKEQSTQFTGSALL